MPSLPTAQDLGVVQLRPGGGVANYRGATGLESAPARALDRLGHQADAITGTLIRVQDEFDETQAEDRYNQYQLRLSEIQNDPNTGWAAAKGENAFKPGFADRYNERFEQERQRIEATLESPQAKRRFNKMAASAVLKHRSAMYSHASKQHIAWAGKVFEDTVKLEEANAWRNFGNDQAFDETLARMKNRTEAYARKWFVGADESSVKLATQTMESRLWRKRIEGALDSDKTDIAQDLYKKASGVLTTDDVSALDGRMKTQVAMGRALKAVDEIFGKLVSSDVNAAFPAVQIDEELRKRFEGRPGLLKAARQEVDYRASKFRQAQAESNNENGSAVVDMFFVKKQPLSAVVKSQAYQNLSGDQRAKFHLQAERYQTGLASRAAAAESRAAAAENRAFTREARQLRRLEQEGEYATLQYMMNPELVRDLTPAAIGALAIDIGPSNANRIATYQRQLTKPGKATDDKMTIQMFKGILQDYAGYKPELLTRKPEDNAEREKQATMSRMYQNINSQVFKRAQELKRDLTPDEKDDIMRRAMKEQVKADFGFFEFGAPKDYEGPAIAMPTIGEDAEAIAGRAVVPIKEIPDDSLRATIDFIKRKRPGFANATDEKILRELRPVIERAAAMGRMNRPKEEVLEHLMRGVK